MDLRRAEFEILVETSLGTNYDRDKISFAAKAQAEMAERQTALALQYDRGEIPAVEYVEKFNDETLRAFQAIEKEFGREDFLTLFGEPPEKHGALIDKDAFIATELQRLSSYSLEAQKTGGAIAPEVSLDSVGAVLVAVDDVMHPAGSLISVNRFAGELASRFITCRIQKICTHDASWEQALNNTYQSAVYQLHHGTNQDLKVLFCSVPSKLNRYSGRQDPAIGNAETVVHDWGLKRVVDAVKSTDKKRHVFALHSEYQSHAATAEESSPIQCWMIVSVGADVKTRIAQYKSVLQQTAIHSMSRAGISDTFFDVREIKFE